MSGNYFSYVDYTTIVIYVCGLVFLGLYLKRKATASLEDYLVGGRNLPWWMLGISGMSQYMDIAGTMVIVSFLYMLGPRGLFIELRGGASLILVIMLLWTGKWHRRSQCLTGAEWMVYRFGDGLAGKTAQFARSLTGIVLAIGLIAYLIKGIGLFLSMFLPFTPLTCAIGMFAAATIYTMISGFYGVVLSDLANSLVVVGSAIFIAILAMGKMTDLQSLSLLAENVTQNPQWTEASPRFQTYMPAGYEQYESLFLFASVYTLRNLLFGMGVGDDPKYFGARSDKECSKLTFLWICLLSVRWPMMIGMAVLGLILVSDTLPDRDSLADVSEIIQIYMPSSETEWATVTSSIVNDPESHNPDMILKIKTLLGENWETKLLLVSYHGNVNPERIMPAVLLSYFPMGFRGLMMIAIIAASMSTFDSLVNSTAGLFVRDIYQKHIRPKASVKELISATWIFILVLVLVSFLFAQTVKSINDIWVWFIMVLGGGLVAPLVLRFYWWRFNGFGFAIGCMVGIFASALQRHIVDYLPENWQYLTNELWSFFILGALGLIASIIGSLLTEPTPEPVLRKFYFTTLPFGWWSHFKQSLPDSLREKVTSEHRRDLAAVPFALIFQIMLFLSPMMFVIHNWHSSALCLLITVVSFLGLYYIWLRHIGKQDLLAAEAKALLDKDFVSN